MELNELRDEADELTQQLNEARLEKEKVERDYNMMRKNLDEYLEKEALEHGYRYPNTKEFTNDMAEN
jgi:recombinational DNA repair protein (RecF pathway)